jgi:hypothetical protein
MRAIRALIVAALMLTASSAAAQSTRGFKDSWFWGLKGGAMIYQVFSDAQGDGSLGPLGGIDWMITRTKGGLYASFDYLYFKDQFVLVNDSISPLDTVPRQVFLTGMRRFTLAGMLFPMQTYWLHPYFGVGVTLNHISKVEPVGNYRNGLQAALVQATIQEFRTSAAPIVIMGAQLKLAVGASAFGQLTVSPAHDNFFLFTGNNWRSSAEVGMRINTGTSIDRMR